jgi:hypothetical protein
MIVLFCALFLHSVQSGSSISAAPGEERVHSSGVILHSADLCLHRDFVKKCTVQLMYSVRIRDVDPVS